MADSKISALPASTTPLAGTEVLPIVQGGVTKQNSVANLTAGRAISATQLTLTTGNLIVASGQGIDFSATPSAGTSELLADYEEGTWTPASTTFGLTVTAATYTKIGRQVFIAFDVTYPSTASASAARITAASLPFTPASASGNFNTGYTSYSSAIIGAISGVGITFYNRLGNPGSGLIESDLSTLRVIGSCTYTV